jgi:hypothetical protein
MAYLIDSDAMVDFPRGNAGAADYLDSLGDDCLLSAITALFAQNMLGSPR